jgi:hypothetical protein
MPNGAGEYQSSYDIGEWWYNTQEQIDLWEDVSPGDIYNQLLDQYWSETTEQWGNCEGLTMEQCFAQGEDIGTQWYSQVWEDLDFSTMAEGNYITDLYGNTMEVSEMYLLDCQMFGMCDNLYEQMAADWDAACFGGNCGENPYTESPQGDPSNTEIIDWLQGNVYNPDWSIDELAWEGSYMTGQQEGYTAYQDQYWNQICLPENMTGEDPGLMEFCSAAAESGLSNYEYAQENWDWDVFGEWDTSPDYGGYDPNISLFDEEYWTTQGQVNWQNLIGGEYDLSTDPFYGSMQSILPWDELMNQQFMFLYGSYMPTTYDPSAVYRAGESANIQKDLLGKRFRQETINPLTDVAGASNLAMTGLYSGGSDFYENLYEGYADIDIDYENALGDIYTGFGDDWLAMLDQFAGPMGEGWAENWEYTLGDETVPGFDIPGGTTYNECMEYQSNNYLNEGFGLEAMSMASGDCNALWTSAYGDPEYGGG